MPADVRPRCRSFVPSTSALRAVLGTATCTLLLAALPAAAGTWHPTGPQGGTVLALAASAEAPRRVFAGAQDGGVFRSTDGGASWHSLAAALPVASVGALAVDPLDANHVLAAAGGTVYRSPDAGATWEAGGPDLDAAVRDLELAASDPRVVYAAGGGLWRSDDGGVTWRPADGDLPADGLIEVAVSPRDPNAAWAALYDTGVYRTTDGGAAWRLALGGTFPRDVLADPVAAGTVYAAGRDGLHVSFDGGDSWRLRHPESGTAPALSTLAAIPGSPGSLLAVEPVRIHGPLSQPSSRVWRIDERGEHWTLLAELEEDVGPLLPGDGLRPPLLGAERTGILAGGDGGTAWSPSVRGLAALGVDAFAAAPSEPSTLYLFSPQTRRVVRSPDGGATWRAAWTPAGGIASGRLVVSPHDPARVYLLELALYRLLPDGSVRWSPIEPGAEHRSLAVDPADPSHLLAVTDRALPCAPLPCTPQRRFRLYSSHDGGASWERTETPGSPTRRLAEVVFAPRRPRVAWLAADGGATLRSRDGGVTWTPTAGTLPAAPDHLAVQPTAAGSRLFAVVPGLAGGVFASSDDGDSWRRLVSGLPAGLQATTLTATPRLGGTVVLGSELHGVFVLAADERWRPLGGDLPALPVERLEVLPAAGVVIAALRGAGGLYRHGVAATCEGGEPGAMCAGGDDRFRVEVAWEDFQGGHGRGVPTALTSAAGYFWFFSPGNAELAVKVLDGRAVNRHFWVFYGALSNVGFDLAVTDTVGGAVRIYSNRARSFASRGDTTAFRDTGTAATAASAPPTVPPSTARSLTPTAAAASTGCDGDPRSLCFFDGRFAVGVHWTDFQGGEGDAVPVALPGQSGYLWFFRRDNLELFVKLLDGRPVNGHFWLFYGSLSNVGFTVTVRDRVSGQRRTYRNPPGSFASFAATGDF